MRNPAENDKMPCKEMLQLAKELKDAAEQYENEHPFWLGETLLSLVKSSLVNLRHYVEAEDEKEIGWDSPFVQLNFPVEWNWEAWERGDNDSVLLISGELTKENTADRAKAVRTMTEILLTHLLVVTMQRLTNFVGLEKRGEKCTPIMLPGMANDLRRIKGKKKRRLALEKLYRPFCITAASLDVGEGEIRPNERIPTSIAKELAKVRERIHIPDLKFEGTIDGHALTIYVIFQIHPLVVDVPSKVAYYPLTVGLLIVPGGATEAEEYEELMSEPWAQPKNWSKKDQCAFWDLLLNEFDKAINEFFPDRQAQIEKIVTVSATLGIPVKHSDTENANEAMEKVTTALLKTGRVLEVSCRAVGSGAPSRADNDSQGAYDALAPHKPDSLTAAWLHRVWDSRFRWWLITPVSLLALLYVVWLSLPDRVKMHLCKLLSRAVFKQT